MLLQRFMVKNPLILYVNLRPLTYLHTCPGHIYVSGTQVYRRFSQEFFTEFLSDLYIPAANVHAAVLDKTRWNQDILPFNLPAGIDIVLGESWISCLYTVQGTMILTVYI